MVFVLVLVINSSIHKILANNVEVDAPNVLPILPALHVLILMQLIIKMEPVHVLLDNSLMNKTPAKFAILDVKHVLVLINVLPVMIKI